MSGDCAEAAQVLEQAFGLYRDLGDPLGEAEVLNHSGALCLKSEDSEQALAHHQRALDLARAVGSPLEEARALEGAGRCALARGDTATAVTELRQALEIYSTSASAPPRRPSWRPIWQIWAPVNPSGACSGVGGDADDVGNAVAERNRLFPIPDPRPRRTPQQLVPAWGACSAIRKAVLDKPGSSGAGMGGGSGDGFGSFVIAGPACSGGGGKGAARLCSSRTVGFVGRACCSRCVIHSCTSTKLLFLSRLVSNCHHTTSKLWPRTNARERHTVHSGRRCQNCHPHRDQLQNWHRPRLSTRCCPSRITAKVSSRTVCSTSAAEG